MFTAQRREQVRTLLLERARADQRIVSAAITGSAAADAEDRWSDVDLFFGVAAGAAVAEILEEWSAFAYRELGALHHFDLQSGPATYRAFLLGDLLEIDLAFTPAAAFGPLGRGGFRVVFGDAAERVPGSADPGHLIGLAWHHVLHARTAIERATPWRAEYWISGIRDHTLSLACIRLGQPSAHAGGADLLPSHLTAPIQQALARSLDLDELARALRAATDALLTELRATDATVFAVLEQALNELAPG